MLSKILYVGAGGFIGSSLRFLTSTASQQLFPRLNFPLGTLLVNTLGCFAIGLLLTLAHSRQLFSPELRMFIFVGILGGFTTFSTFGYESFAMLVDRQPHLFILNIGLNLILGLLAVWGGMLLARFI